jgi:hypothetical protein
MVDGDDAMVRVPRRIRDPIWQSHVDNARRNVKERLYRMPASPKDAELES